MTIAQAAFGTLQVGPPRPSLWSQLPKNSRVQSPGWSAPPYAATSIVVVVAGEELAGVNGRDIGIVWFGGCVMEEKADKKYQASESSCEYCADCLNGVNVEEV